MNNCTQLCTSLMIYWIEKEKKKRKRKFKNRSFIVLFKSGSRHIQRRIRNILIAVVYLSSIFFVLIFYSSFFSLLWDRNMLQYFYESFLSAWFMASTRACLTISLVLNCTPRALTTFINNVLSTTFYFVFIRVVFYYQGNVQPHSIECNFRFTSCHSIIRDRRRTLR